MVVLGSFTMISCETKTSPLDTMVAPIHLVRNDSVIEVKDGAGKLYVLNTEERTAYRTAFLKPGDVLAVNSIQE